MQNSNIEKLVIDYLENNVVESIKECFTMRVCEGCKAGAFGKRI